MEHSLLDAEIRAQPLVLERFLAHGAEAAGAAGAALRAARPRGLWIAARGSSDHAATYAKYLWGERLRVPVALAAPSLASVYERGPDLRGWAALGISQSGASPDVAGALAHARAQGCPTAAITDDPDSPLGRAVEHVVPLGLGGERSVAATGSFTTSLLALAEMARGWDPDAAPWSASAAAPDLARRALACGEACAALGRDLAGAPQVGVLGRGYGFAVALEWSLKWTELCARLAVPWSAADFRHGPIALAGPDLSLALLDLGGPASAGIAALAEDLRGRGARVSRVGPGQDDAVCLRAEPEWLAAIPFAIAGQQVAVAAARALGRDPDAPAGLTKVTRTR